MGKREMYLTALPTREAPGMIWMCAAADVGTCVAEMEGWGGCSIG